MTDREQTTSTRRSAAMTSDPQMDWPEIGAPRLNEETVDGK